MKVRVYVIDLEIPPRVKNWALRVGLPLAVLIVGGVAYADLPHPSWQDGDTLKAADLTANFQYLQGEITGDGGLQAQIPIATGWTAVSGLLLVDGNGTLGSQSTKASWRRVGDTMEVSIETDFTGQPTSSGGLFWSLPNGVALDIAKLSRGQAMGTAYVATSPFVACLPYFAGGLKQVVLQCGTSSPAGLPTGIVAGSAIVMHLSFPVAGWGVTN